jgi:high-affinity iron transporter
MLALAVILAGKTIHELVEAGYIQATPLAGVPSIEILGLYPSMETLAAQLVLISVGVVLALFMRRRRRA